MNEMYEDETLLEYLARLGDMYLEKREAEKASRDGKKINKGGE